MLPRPLLPAFLLVVVAAPSGAQLTNSMIARINSEVTRPGGQTAPGCAMGLYQNGRILYARGFGAANLEYGTTITPTTPFIVGSLSKQFTAASIALLVQDGRLSLDDNVRTYVPELPDYGKPITIRHLVHHTSGLRDFWALVDVAGMRTDDAYTTADVLALASRQRTLNFAPGDKYLYSNTGYIVLGVVVQRVSGMSLREFAAQRLFAPLGMTGTHYHDSHTMIVPGRASAYSPGPAGWRINVWNNDLVGQGGVMTSIADLIKWDENFYTAAVGGRPFIDMLLTRGRLNDATQIAYAFGLEVGTYRGLPMVEHTGSTGGYRTVLTRFPSTHTTVALLCNASNIVPATMARRIADVVLEGRFTAAVPAAGAATPAGAATTNPAVTAATTPVAAAGARGAGGRAGPTIDAALAQRAAGRYYSDELDTTYELVASGTTLVLRRTRATPDTLTLAASTPEAVTLRGRIGSLVFPGGTATAATFTLDAGRVQSVVFVRR